LHPKTLLLYQNFLQVSPANWRGKLAQKKIGGFVSLALFAFLREKQNLFVPIHRGAALEIRKSCSNCFIMGERKLSKHIGFSSVISLGFSIKIWEELQLFLS
jgi:hypothetical protein